MKLADYAVPYKTIYRLHNIEVADFFRRHSPESLYTGTLEDPEKWQKLGEFLGIDVPKYSTCQENVSMVNDN